MTFEDSSPRSLRERRIMPKVAVHSSARESGQPLKKHCACRKSGAAGEHRPKQRRQGGARFYAALTDDQIRTVEMIVRGFQLRTSGIGMRTQSFSILPPSTGNIEEKQSELVRRFMRWAVAVQQNGMSVATVLDIIVFEKSFRTVDRERQKRNGFSRSQLLDSLDLYDQRIKNTQ
ncbi:hypothetical protein [uncultured Sneathiella sp.]|uniref:hypothetical protein n=1 Tax=uncultured Sneathiella sp. TaxID=879315 RepID=UPI0030ED732E|tara:strand:- start:13124 stop:13648 length:525 start_codon:yes stop_codon:yes gene_type:complete